MKSDPFVHLIHLARACGLTFGFAESCTGGLLSSLITMNSGVSDVYMGSIVSYSNAVKLKVLGVLEATLAAHGAVSEPTAIEMARGARIILDVDWCVSITGIAGPTGGSTEKPVGTVCFASIGTGLETSVKKRFDGTREEIQRQSAEFAASWLASLI